MHLGVAPELRPARKAHPALLVHDLAAMVERLRRSGREVQNCELLDGVPRAYVDDPFGNRMELVSAD